MTPRPCLPALLVLGLLVLPSAATGHADVWQRAIDTTDATNDRYQDALLRGDDHATRANARNLSSTEITRLVDTSVRAYEDAAKIRPQEAEPYFRIAAVLDSFFIDCERGFGVRPATCAVNNQIDPARGKQVVAAWDAFEQRAPLDPRVGEILFSRAILRTKLVVDATTSRALLQGAMRDYQLILRRADGLTGIRLDQVWGNLAETHMMLGELDEAIDAYTEANRRGAGHSTYYGLAVALDRDGRAAEALDVIRRQGPRSFMDFKQEYLAGAVFYVPAGEEHYYFGLIHEAFGYVDQAIIHWRAYLKSGAHKQFHARAKVHIDQLLIKQKKQPQPRGPIDDDLDLMVP